MRTQRPDSGYALITVLIALALLATIGAALTAMGGVEYRTAVNHRSATRALMLADAAATHAVALMRGPLEGYTYSDVLVGPDGTPDTGDDGLLAGYGLAPGDAIPDTGVALGRGRYFVELTNDPDPSGDPFADTNHRIVALCRGETPDGAVAEVGVVLHAPAFPAIVANGDLTMPGNPDVLGPCAGVHANGDLFLSGNPVVDGGVGATGDVIGSATVRDADGDVVTPESGRPPVEVPEYDPLAPEYCGQADYVLRNGWVVDAGATPPDSSFAGGSGALGWKWSSANNTYSLNGKKAVPGTVCAYGNVQVTGNTGSDGNPLEVSLFSSGSVQVAGNPRIEAAHDEGALIVARGDVKISGNASGATPAFSGLVYAGAQCQVNGTPEVKGHILCRDEPNPAGASDLVDGNRVNGTPTVTYDCTGKRQETFIAAWWESRAR